MPELGGCDGEMAGLAPTNFMRARKIVATEYGTILDTWLGGKIRDIDLSETRIEIIAELRAIMRHVAGVVAESSRDRHVTRQRKCRPDRCGCDRPTLRSGSVITLRSRVKPDSRHIEHVRLWESRRPGDPGLRRQLVALRSISFPNVRRGIGGCEDRRDQPRHCPTIHSRSTSDRVFFSGAMACPQIGSIRSRKRIDRVWRVVAAVYVRKHAALSRARDDDGIGNTHRAK